VANGPSKTKLKKTVNPYINGKTPAEKPKRCV
jgi:hypothetical protein